MTPPDDPIVIVDPDPEPEPSPTTPDDGSPNGPGTGTIVIQDPDDGSSSNQSGGGNAGTNGGGEGNLNEIDNGPEQEVDTSWIGDGSVPLITIGGTEVPLYPPAGAAAWALLNLILSVICAIFAATAGLRTILRERDRKRGGEYESVYDYIPDGTIEADADATPDGKSTAVNEKEKSRKRKLLWLAAAGAATVAGVILFIVTQDMSAPMVLIDWWTLTHAVLLAVGIVTSRLAVKIIKDTVTFDTNGGTKPFKKKIYSGSVVATPKTPTRQGYAFAGWYTDSEFRYIWDFERTIHNDLTLYAKWQPAPS